MIPIINFFVESGVGPTFNIIYKQLYYFFIDVFVGVVECRGGDALEPSQKQMYGELLPSNRSEAAVLADVYISLFSKKLQSSKVKYFSEQDVSWVFLWKYDPATPVPLEDVLFLNKQGADCFYPIIRDPRGLSESQRIDAFVEPLLFLNTATERARFIRAVGNRLEAVSPGSLDAFGHAFKWLSLESRNDRERVLFLEFEAGEKMTRDFGILPHLYYKRLMSEVLYYENVVMNNELSTSDILMEDGKLSRADVIDDLASVFDDRNRATLVELNRARRIYNSEQFPGHEYYKTEFYEAFHELRRDYPTAYGIIVGAAAFAGYEAVGEIVKFISSMRGDDDY